MATQDLEARLAAEAEYQNRRSTGQLDEFEERRNKFYYLADRARALYMERIQTLSKGRRVVVVGCAEGGVTPLARGGARSVLGIDIADEAIANLNRAIQDEGLAQVANAVVGNAEALDLDPASQDLICCSGVLHHLDIEASMRSWSQTLSDEGQVVMMEPMAYNPLVALYRVLTPAMRTDDEHPLVPRDVRIMERYFQKVEVRGFVLTSLASAVFSYLPGMGKLRGWTCTALEAFDRVLLGVLPPLRYLCWTSVITLQHPKRS
ncbi:MAG: methyltransferase domain-containing protein [Planctomycetes bacterium]|nr:methyltransferase domain-containing protein [Planctomycetota bacterium]MCB9910704.1 methyltransferase domain-containing protein [Planctomycetota bacterium]HPF15309.1 class I SAM-dependent methyltransferase [Planctomycetota bacterium]HRV82415.1 class I SAM-dependent methyltransferase [Planctomycetota bacterium]